MKDFKELSTLIDKYLKAYDENGNEIDGKASDYYSEIVSQLEFLFDWDSKLDEITKEMNLIRKEIKTHIHSEGMVYVKL
jgi:hypothetical protein